MAQTVSLSQFLLSEDSEETYSEAELRIYPIASLPIPDRPSLVSGKAQRDCKNL
jgi:hypothetical protein